MEEVREETVQVPAGEPSLMPVQERLKTGRNEPHTLETAMSHFYWAAAEEFTRRGFGLLLDFGSRHGLLADGSAAAARTELVRLRGVLAPV